MKRKTADPWKELKKKLILDALLRNNGSPTHAARDLGISRQMVHRYINKMGL